MASWDIITKLLKETDAYDKNKKKLKVLTILDD